MAKRSTKAPVFCCSKRLSCADLLAWRPDLRQAVVGRVAWERAADELAIEACGQDGAALGKLRQEAVVIAGAVAETGAVGIEEEPGHEAEVDLRERDGLGGVCGDLLQRTAGGDKRCLGREAASFHRVIGQRAGEADGFSLCPGGADEGVGVPLARKAQKKQHGFCADHARIGADHTHERLRLPVTLGGRKRLSARFSDVSPFVFRHSHPSLLPV